MICEPDPCSPVSEDSTSGSPAPDSSTPGSASPTHGAEPCSPPTGPECPSTTTFETWALDTYNQSVGRESPPLRNTNGTFGDALPAIFSAEGSPARTSASPDAEPGSQGTDPAFSSSSPESSTLFDPDGFSSRTYPVSSLATAVGTSEQCLERWPTSGTAWDGGFSTHVSSECRSDGAGCSSSQPSLTEILEPPQNVAGKYSLSARAAQGILRRAEKRGRTLPAHLAEALALVAGTTATPSTGGGRSSLSGMGTGGPDDNDAQAGRIVSYALNAKQGKRDDGEPETFVTGFHQTQDPIAEPDGSPALGRTSIGMGVGVGVGVGVRRLTPVECERLQAWPDQWTNPAGDASDSRRYAACGDGVTASVSEWIGRRLTGAA